MTSTNSTVESTNSTQMKTLYLVIACIAVVFVIASNLILLHALMLKSEIRKNYRIEFILWLCLSDIVVGISGLLLVCNYLIRGLSKNTHYCSLMYHFLAAGIGQSLAQTFLICIDRHMAVVANVSYKLFNKKYRYIVIFGTWLFMHAYVGTLVVVWMRVDHITYCSLTSYPNHKLFLTGINILFLPILFAIPGLYISTIITFKNRSRRTYHLPDLTISTVTSTQTSLCPFPSIHYFEMTRIRQKYQRQVITTIGLIVVALLFLSGPFIIIVLFLEGCGLIAVKTSTRMLFTMMAYCNSAANPILYGWRIRKIREIVTKLFCKTSPIPQY
ncbi:5-hydroxytryptamine receptor 6 [Mizuhopecten yessoensis]|uniref:5-hydroxytryptamine receptor 6 n=1 Tax=Mizuhopecten yessoensis TaxID=6573 RepID=A0A210PLH0_MIZYE|nr:5-hydroxytryptamine receptor 6 [Mizuhopecten yessoensis]